MQFCLRILICLSVGSLYVRHSLLEIACQGWFARDGLLEMVCQQ